MQTCPYCKSDIPADSTVCHHCGEELYICLKCQRPSTGKWCTRCGSPLVKASDRASILLVDPSQRKYVTKADASKTPDQNIEKIEEEIASPEPELVAEERQVGNASKRLKLVRTDDDSFVVKLKDGCIIGRVKGDFVDLFGNMNYVSGSHAMVEFDDELQEWAITDLNSTNGTKVNGTRLTPNQPTPIRVGDTIRIAYTEFIVK